MTNVILLKNASIPTDPYHTKFTNSPSLTTTYIPHFIPLLTHTHHPSKESTIEYLSSSEFVFDTPIFIITSQRAVEMFRECLEELDIDIRSQILKKIGYTVGPATARILSQVGFNDVRGGENAGNGSKLAEIVMNDVDSNEKKKIVFLTGEIRRDIIPKKLIGCGYDLRERVIYKTNEREDVKENFLETKKRASNGGWIVFFSPQGTGSIVEELKHDQTSWKIASIGPTTEEYLESNGLKPNVIAKKPDPDSLYEEIINYVSINNNN